MKTPYEEGVIGSEATQELRPRSRIMDLPCCEWYGYEMVKSFFLIQSRPRRRTQAEPRPIDN